MPLELWGKRPGKEFFCHCSGAKVRAMCIALWLHFPSVSVLIHLSGELIKVNTDLSFTCWQTWAICTHSPMALLIIPTWVYHQIVGFILFLLWVCVEVSTCGYIFHEIIFLERSDPWNRSYRWLGCESSELEVGNKTWALCKSSTPYNCWPIIPAMQKHMSYSS